MSMRFVHKVFKAFYSGATLAESRLQGPRPKLLVTALRMLDELCSCVKDVVLSFAQFESGPFLRMNLGEQVEAVLLNTGGIGLCYDFFR